MALPPQHVKNSSPLRLILSISAGLLRDAALRRKGMVCLLGINAVIVFFGAVVLDTFLEERPLLFLGYWMLCAALTLLMILLSVFDMLMVRRQARRMHRVLKKSVFGEDPDSSCKP